MISGIILASGFSRRMGKEKLLLEVGGIPMLERVIQAAQASMLDELMLVYHRGEMRELGEKYCITTVFNPHPEDGQSAALKAGVKRANPASNGFMFLVGDQPYLNSSTINTLIAVFKKDTNRIVVPVYGEARGNPVIFPFALRHELLRLEGDRGGRSVIEHMEHWVTFVAIQGEMEATDIDTAEDYAKVKDSPA